MDRTTRRAPSIVRYSPDDAGRGVELKIERGAPRRTPLGTEEINMWEGHKPRGYLSTMRKLFTVPI